MVAEAEGGDAAAQRRNDEIVLALRALQSVETRLPFNRYDLSPDCESVLTQLAFEILEGGGRSFESFTAEEMAEILEPLAWLWMLPHRILARGALMDQRDLWVYFMAMAQAMRAVLPVQGDLDLERLVRELRRVQRAYEGGLKPAAGWHKVDEVWWTGPFCSNEEAHDVVQLNPVPMTRKKGGNYVCPDCGFQVENPMAPAQE